MPKLTLPIMAAISALASLAACIPPPYPPQYPPPPRFRPHGPYPPEMVAPEDRGDTLVAPDNSIQPVYPPQPAPPPPSATGGYPTARSTDNPDQVISPYEPYNVIDISNPRIPSGKLARDPTNNKIFRVP